MRKAVGVWQRRRDDRLQLAILTVGIASVVVALLAWHPWVGPTEPRVVMRVVGNLDNPIIPARIGAIPDPPVYPADRASEHCDLWSRWLAHEHAVQAFRSGPAGFAVEISAPDNATVSIRGMSVHVFRSFKPRSVSYIECDRDTFGEALGFSAGQSSGFTLDPIPMLYLSLAHPNLVPRIDVASEAGGKPRSLASSTVVSRIKAGTTDTLFVVPRGHRGRVYEWSLDLPASYAQKRDTLKVGSRERPLRSWLGPYPKSGFDYDLKTHAWRRVR